MGKQGQESCERRARAVPGDSDGSDPNGARLKYSIWKQESLPDQSQEDQFQDEDKVTGKLIRTQTIAHSDM